MQEDSLSFYNGGVRMGKKELLAPYTGTGTLIFFGRTNENDPTKSHYYEGCMMEARLWYRAMTGGQIGTTYGFRRLTGYEMGLVDYYPMNEGSGNYALDKTQGANAQLKGASWAMPRGWSLRLDNDVKGIELTDNALNRTSDQDYTLMMWFKTDVHGRGVLVANGAGLKDELNANNQFCLGFEAEKLLYKTRGMTVEVPGNWSDGQWHHLAMTVNRSFNVANIYVDQVLRTSFQTDSLGGISGGTPLIGAARYSVTDEKGNEVTIDTRNWLTGYVDELCLFAQALPLSLIQRYATRSPKGDEAGLLTYLAFEQQERQKDNDLELVPYPYSKKIYLDDKNEVRYQLDPETKEPTQTPVRDYLFVSAQDEILKRITNEDAAPIVPNEELKNLNFSFVGKDNQVLVDINSRDIVGVFDRNNVCHGFSNVEVSARTGESNVYLTVYDSLKHGRDLYFKLWQYSTGRELVLTVDNVQTMKFNADSIAGIDNPVILMGGTKFVQMMDLKEGWNWISFNVRNTDMDNIDSLLGGFPWQEGDMLTELNGTATLLYEKGRWMASGSTDNISLTHKTAYAVKVGKDIKFPIAGDIIKAMDERTI